jgi:UDP-N-acetylmuramate dehydrogenase
VNLSKLVNFSLDRGLVGLEFLAGIPGEVGGAIRGNAGAFGGEIKEYIESVEVIRDGKIIEVPAAEADFKYRESAFKHNNDIILSGIFKLKEGNAKEAQEKAKEYLEYRKEKHPWEPSAGSTFKNIKDKRLAVGKLIEDCGLKGRRVGNAKISEKHANFIVNLGNAKAADVLELISLAKKCVKEKFNIDLEEEIRIIK